MEPRGVSEDNQVNNSHPSSSSSSGNEVVVNKQRSADVETRSSRIPSHVFATTSTKSKTEWSAASNESLFSIHVGNMSFNDNLSSVSKSGELGPVSSRLFEFPVYNLSTPATEAGKLKSDGGGGHESVNDVAIKTMREVLKENESEKKKGIDKEPDHLVRTMSQPSDTSFKSFAFPVAVEADKNNSNKRDTQNKTQPSCQNSTTTTPQHTAPETPKPLRVPETPKAEAQNKSSTSKATQNGGPKRWFSCFSCFSSCS